jgi:L-ascorbate metabolism protein UlaG (beta-lactamase superfamily)
MADGAVTASREGPAADRIAFLGHATVLIELDGVRVLTDPLLRSRVVHLRRQSARVDPGAIGTVDAVLISHLHHDHLDLASLRQIGLDTQIFVPVGAGDWLRRRGFTTVDELDVGGLARVGSLTLTAVPARHDGRRLGGPRAQTLGYLVRGGRTVYFAGDTELFDEMADLATGLDVALLPIAGWGPTLGPGHMGPSDAAHAAALLKPRLAIPIHWGTFLPVGMARRERSRLGDPPRRFAEQLAQLAPGVEARVLAPGQDTWL